MFAIPSHNYFMILWSIPSDRVFEKKVITIRFTTKSVDTLHKYKAKCQSQVVNHPLEVNTPSKRTT